MLRQDRTSIKWKKHHRLSGRRVHGDWEWQAYWQELPTMREIDSVINRLNAAKQ